MSDGCRIGLPQGLPACLVSQESGFAALCRLLAIETRKQKQDLVNNKNVRKILKDRGISASRDQKTSLRLQQEVTGIYSRPDVRRMAWKIYFKFTEGYQKPLPEEGPPSLEYQALRQYDPSFHKAAVDNERLSDCAHFYEVHDEQPRWRSPALALLPLVHADLMNWAELPEERQQNTLLAAFAIATLLDDARILHWAAEQDVKLAVEFQFAMEEKAVSMEDHHDAAEGAGVGGDSTPVGTDAARTALQDACERLSATALELGAGAPSSELFDQIDRCAAEVAQLREPVLSAAAAWDAKALIARQSDFLRAQSERAPWLAAGADDIASRWRNAYPMGDAETVSALRADIERSERATLENLDLWVHAAAKVSENSALLNERNKALEASKGNLASQLNARKERDACAAALAASQSHETEAQQGILDAVSPFGEYDAVGEDPTVAPEDADHRAPRHRETSLAPDSPSDQAQNTPPVGVDAERPVENEKAPPSELARVRTPPERVAPDAQPAAVGDAPKPVTLDEQPDPSVSKDKTALVQDPHVDAMWRSLREGRGGLAYQIALLKSQVESPELRYPASDLIANVVLGRAICGPEDKIAHTFSKHAEVVLGNLPFEDDDPDTKDALNLLLFSAAVRPALFAPLTGAISMLQGVELSSELAPVYHLSDAITGHTPYLQGLHLDLGQFSAVLDGTVWEDRLERHVQEVNEWRAAAESEEFLYKPAAKVWRHWMQKGGILFDLANLLSGSSSKSFPKVEQLVDVLAVDKKLTRLIDDTLQNKLNLKHAGRITGRGRAQIDGDIAKAVILARKWLRIVESKPGGERFVEGRVSDLRADIERHAPLALAAIAAVQERTPGLALSAALAWAHDLVEEISIIFGHDRDVLQAEPPESPPGILTEDLVYVAGIDIGPNGAVAEGASPTDVLALLVDSDSHMKTLGDAFDARLRRGDLAGAQTACELMARQDDPREDECQNTLDQRLAEQRPELERDLDELSEKLEQAYTGREIPEDERDRLKAEIVQARTLLAQKDSVVETVKHVSGFKGVIERRFKKVVDRIGSEVTPFLSSLSEKDRSFVTDALASEDLITLYEVRDMLKKGESVLPKESSEYLTVQTRLPALTRLDDALERKDAPALHDLIAAAADGEDIEGLNFSALSATEAERTNARLKLWYELARNRKARPEHVTEFLESIGFAVRNCQSHGDNSFSANVEPLRGREFCPVPAFGSDADGRYEVVLNWRTPAKDRILQAVPENITRCVLVFHFGRLSSNERERLRKSSMRSRRRFLTIDENLILYLSSLRGATLRTFFDCTLPFAAVQPYFTAAGLVPPESFYGREDEREKLEDPRGSCFVYGGRQLGKTALLRSVEDSFHKPESRHLAKWIDLKAHDIGYAHGAEAIWKTLWTAFVDLGVIEAGLRVPTGRDGFAESVTNAVHRWVFDVEDSRILLLLDEADAFLADDLKKDFRESTQLKGLMDRTDRKFKVVFSGLHNVVRATNRANHPLAHFGDPVCVGPLRSNGELEEVRAMIREPLAAAGGELEADNLSVHIQAWTNYYPSLIQLYGASLVEYLRNTPDREFPYSVHMDDIKAVFARNKLRDSIRERFALTLQLDPRYEVIAYAMAFEFQGKEGERLSDGMLTRDIQEHAKGWWEDGFEISDKEFATLLEEMEGLGVLRKQRAEGSERPRYTFRNPNILLLLGDSKDIEAVLDSGEREVQGAFEEAEFHAPHSKGKEGAELRRRGPLSYEQESLLLRRGGVAVVTGTETANIANIRDFLNQRIDEKRFVELEERTNEADFGSFLRSRRPGQSGVHIYLVPKGTGWNIKWITTAADALKDVRRGHYMRVVFQADPNDLWNFVSALDDAYLEDENGLFDWFGLQPWSYAFLRQWCSDLNLPIGASHVRGLLEDSGGWPTVLEHYAEHYAESPEKSVGTKQRYLADYISENPVKLIGDFGLGSPQAQKEIDALRYFSAFTPDEASEIVSAIDVEDDLGLSSHTLVRRLWWARRLGLIQDVQGARALNSLVENILPKSFS